MRNSAIELFPLDQPALDAAKQSFRTWCGDRKQLAGHQF